MSPLAPEKLGDRLLEPPMEQVLVAGMGDEGGRAARSGQACGKVKAMDAGQEKQRPYAVVEAGARVAKGLERCGLGEQVVRRRRAADALQRPVADRRLVGLDDRDQPTGGHATGSRATVDHGAAHGAWGWRASRSTS